MNAKSSLPRYLTAISLLILFLLPVTIQGAPIPTGSPIMAAENPLSIILMIGDGMGYEHVELARLVEVGEAGSLAMQQLTWNASVTTYCANNPITDSAAAATAIATGYKTNRYYVGMNSTGQSVQSILEYAQTLNKSTGVVSTSYIEDATPASFMAHVIDRSSYSEIARQIVEEANVDVLLGGGLSDFTPTQLSTMESNGYSLVYNRTAMMNVVSGKIFGIFADHYMDYELDRNYSVTPSIAEMTNKSLELLSQDPDGFFLMVEGGRIDTAAHAADKVRNALDTIAFDNAIQESIDYVNAHNNTILIVTADHETGGLLVVSHNLNTELPAALSTESEKRTLRAERANNVTVSWTSTSHTDTPVPLFCYGSYFDALPSGTTIDNTNIYSIMKEYYQSEAPIIEPVATTTPTTTSTSPTTTPTAPLDMTLFLIASVGIVIIVVVVVVINKRR
ncbi:MAG: alkaline phosphatase [Promethearchaeota archaeon]